MKKTGMASLVLVLTLMSGISVSASSDKYQAEQQFTLSKKMSSINLPIQFNGESMIEGNNNYFGISEVRGSDKNVANQLSIDTQLNFDSNYEQSLSENEIHVSGQVIVHFTKDVPLNVDGIISKYTKDGKTYYFGPLLTKFDYKGESVNGTVGIFYNETDNKTNISIWIGEIGNKNGSSLINYGDSLPEQTEVIQSFQKYLDETNQENASILSTTQTNEISSNTTSDFAVASSDYFRHAISLGTSYTSGGGKDGYASNWVANEHIYVNDAKSRDQFTSTILWRDKLFTNNESLLKYMSVSGATNYLTVNNYSVDVTLSGADSSARLTDSTPTDSNRVLPVAWKFVKQITPTAAVQIVYNSLASIYNSGLDRVYSGNTYRTFTNNMSSGENTAIDHLPGNIAAAPGYNDPNEKYGMSHEVLAYLPNASTSNKQTGKFTSNTNVVWYYSNSNGGTGYPLANLNGSFTFYTNP